MGGKSTGPCLLGEVEVSRPAKRGGAKKQYKVEEVVPAAARTIASLRDIGYELPQAVADVVDNSISAGASEVEIQLEFDGGDSWIRIADNGCGMDGSEITEALRYGSARDYEEEDLGKFGFGLKTASTSQCRKVLVASRHSIERAVIEARALDLEHIEQTNRWEILVLDKEARPRSLVEPLKETTGTVILWEDLDRILDYEDKWGGWAKRKLIEAADAIAEHLAMVFHRFLAGQVKGCKLRITVNGSPVEPWDPFCSGEDTINLPEHDLQVASDAGYAIVRVSPHVLPGKTDFSSQSAWERASGPLRWNRQQGLYIYRADRLIQWGGWSRLRTIDEHTKLARVAVDFNPVLDSAFGINISKAIVKIPNDLRDKIKPVIDDACRAADYRYRKSIKAKGSTVPPRANAGAVDRNDQPPTKGLGYEEGSSRIGGNEPRSAYPAPRMAIEAAAAAAGEKSALNRIVKALKASEPRVARDLGW